MNNNYGFYWYPLDTKTTYFKVSSHICLRLGINRFIDSNMSWWSLQNRFKNVSERAQFPKEFLLYD